ncbi:MAG: undecaprenyl-diphosphate phosphatase [Frankiaceae bacterium]|nr:undecaprenyl-diphosphate phosphatase [Frankiaceae bacterium]
MNPLQAIVYGIIQGLTEFLPVSSSGHLRVAPALFGWSDPGAAFTAVIQLGTMAAVVLYFWRELLNVTVAWLRGHVDRSVRSSLEYKMGWYLVIATIPVVVLGLVFSHQIETWARNLWLIAGALIAIAVAMLLADRAGQHARVEENINYRDAIAIGVAQAMALVPGVSRSGATISAGLFRGLTREAAARFSFLLSVPAVVGSGLFEARKIGAAGAPGMGVTVLATILSFGVGLASIAWLIRYIGRHSMLVFIIYRVALGALLLALLSRGAISAT